MTSPPRKLHERYHTHPTPPHPFPPTQVTWTLSHPTPPHPTPSPPRKLHERYHTPPHPTPPHPFPPSGNPLPLVYVYIFILWLGTPHRMHKESSGISHHFTWICKLKLTPRRGVQFLVLALSSDDSEHRWKAQTENPTWQNTEPRYTKIIQGCLRLYEEKHICGRI